MLEGRHCSVIVHGSGRFAVNIATMPAAGIGWVHVNADGIAIPEGDCGYLGQRRWTAAAAGAAIRRAAPDVLADPLPRRRLPDLVILTDAEVPEPAVVANLSGHGARNPHLGVRCAAGAGCAGPRDVAAASALRLHFASPAGATAGPAVRRGPEGNQRRPASPAYHRKPLA